MKLDDLNKKCAVAFVHIPSGEVGRTEYNFTLMTAKQLCDELDGICGTILHFVLIQGDDIYVRAKERQRGHKK
ncbi:MAG: hypothetical protein A2Z69_02335 [Bacteroidetes bacterium RBG_13_44_24]|nr:MAG: hypothetical protein A2Z69_02335 [Bacteroidetes bacterium RBG_13_44_24]